MAHSMKPVPNGYHTVTPCLTLRNSAAALAFYKRAFNAKVLDSLPSPDGKGTMHATLKIGDSILMMGDERPGQTCKSAESLVGSPVSFYVYVPDADAAFGQAVGAGASVVMPVADMFWGDRCGTVKDPFGYSWSIATHRRDLTLKEIQEGAESFFASAAKA